MVKQRQPGGTTRRSWAPWAFALLAAQAFLGCGTVREFTEPLTALTKPPEDDPLRGRSRPARAEPGMLTQIEEPRNQVPVAEVTREMPSVPATLAPSPAALTVAPRLKGDSYLGIDNPPRRVGGSAVEPAGFPGGASALEQAWEQLKARGVNWHQLERQGDQWHLRCTIPNPADPNVSRFFEATAADEATAIWGVIEKIDGQR